MTIPNPPYVDDYCLIFREKCSLSTWDIHRDIMSSFLSFFSFASHLLRGEMAFSLPFIYWALLHVKMVLYTYTGCTVWCTFYTSSVYALYIYFLSSLSFSPHLHDRMAR